MLTILTLTIVSCDNNMVYENNKTIPESVWHSDNIMKFNVKISDTTLKYNFYLNIRIKQEYQFANLFLFQKTLFPDGKMSNDTIECFLADVDGRWLGKNSGSIIDNRILLYKNVRFKQYGTYSFEFEQAMRDTALANVEDFGIRIEKTE